MQESTWMGCGLGELVKLYDCEILGFPNANESDNDAILGSGRAERPFILACVSLLLTPWMGYCAPPYIPHGGKGTGCFRDFHNLEGIPHILIQVKSLFSMNGNKTQSS